MTAPIPDPPRRTGEAPAYSVVAAILVMVGGVIIPFLGWMAGIAMMWSSTAWPARQKWIATLLPVVIGFLAVAIGVIAPGLLEFGSGRIGPLMGLFFALVAAAGTGVWLLFSRSARTKEQS